VIKRWLKKREFMVYYLLELYARSMGKRCFNEGDLVDLVSTVIGSKRVSRNIIRHLIRQGLLEREKPLFYCIKDFDEVFRKVLVEYIAGRLRRRGVECAVENGKIVVHSDYCSQVEPLKRIQLIACSQ